MFFIYCNIGLHKEEEAGYWSVDDISAIQLLSKYKVAVLIYIGMKATTNLSDW